MGEQNILIKNIADRFEIKPEDAKVLLTEWVAKLRDELDSHGSIEIEKFGTFKKEESGISFEPSEELALEVNHKYAGMQPIEILPAYRKGAVGESGKKAESDQQEKPEITEDDNVIPFESGSYSSDDEDYIEPETPDEQDSPQEADQSEAEVDDEAAQKEDETAEDQAFEESDEPLNQSPEFNEKFDTEAEDDEKADEDDDFLSPYDEDYLPAGSGEIDASSEKESGLDSDSFEETAKEEEDAGDEEEESGETDETAEDQVFKESDEPLNQSPEINEKFDTEAGDDEKADEDDDILSPYDEDYLHAGSGEIDESSEKESDLDSESFGETGKEEEDAGDEEEELGEADEQDLFLNAEEEYIPPAGYTEDDANDENEKSEQDFGDDKPFELEEDDEEEYKTPFNQEEEDESLISPENKEYNPKEESVSDESNVDEESESQKIDAFYTPEIEESETTDDEFGSEEELAKPENIRDSKSDEQEKLSAKSGDKAKSKSGGKNGKITAGVVVAIVLIAGFLFIFLYEFNGTDPAASDDAQEAGPVVADEEEDIEQETAPEETEEEAEAPETEEWGYRGDYIDMDDYYTIVVHSIRNRSSAEAEYEEIADQEFRATLNSYTPQADEERWRVGIGQFESVEEAVEATDELPEPWKSNHFIIRIR